MNLHIQNHNIDQNIIQNHNIDQNIIQNHNIDQNIIKQRVRTINFQTTLIS